MDNNYKIEILKRRIAKHPTSSPSLWFYYLGIAKFKFEESKYTKGGYGISFKFNKWNPLTLAYLLHTYTKSIVEGVAKGHRIYKNKVGRMQGTAHMIYLDEN